MKRFTFVASLLLACIGMNAQSWTKPAAPAAMPLTLGAECYLYNVDADAFFLGSYDWTTRASVKPLRGYKVYIEKYELEGSAWDGQSYYITDLIEDGDKAGTVQCLFIDDINSIWVDRLKTDTEDKAWTFTTVEGNDFRIGLSMLNEKNNPDTRGEVFLGTIASYGETRLYMTTTDTEGACLTWRFVTPENYSAYIAAVQQWQAATPLGAAIADAKERFPGADISAAEAVYNNHASTADQLKTAHRQLTQALLAYASPDKPVQMTHYITNPTYADNERSGWEGTEPGFQNWGNAEFFNKNFDMYQTIKNLPAGVYNARVRAFYRAGDADADAEQRKEIEEGREATQNARLYANTTVLGATESRLPLLSTGATEAAIGSGTLQNYFGYVPNDMHTAFDYFEAGQFQHTGVMNYTDDGSLTIGLRKSETIGNDWTLFDEWELEYLGNTDEALARLREQAIAAWPDYAQLIDNNEIPYYGRAAWQTYQQADAALKGATKAADIAAALKQFKEAADAFQKNVEAYAAYAEMFNDANAFVDERQVDLMGEDMELLEEYLGENLEPSATLKHPNGTALYILDNGTLSTDQIAAETKYLEQLRDNALAGGMVDGMDCTNLIKNPHFETADHWVKEGLPEYPAGTDTYKVGQAYTILFGVSQEITGLQNGLYELSLSDFFRPADYGSSDWTENHQAYVFMNNFKRRLNLITDEALNEAIDGHTYEVGGFGYVPNTVEEAAQSFEAGHYKQTLYGLVTDGTMKIGLRNNLRYEGCWAVWSDLHLTFRAKNPDVLAEVIENALPEAEDLKTAVCGKEELNTLATAIQNARKANDDTSYDAMVALQKAMDDVNEGVAAYAVLATTIDNLEETIGNYPDADDIELAKQTLSTVKAEFEAGAYNNEQAVAKNEEIGALIVSIKLGDSTGEQEQDVSDLIVNRNFDPEKGSKNEGRIDGWITTAMNGYKEFTVSYNRAGFELYQDLTGLPKGKYKVTVHTYYRAGYWYDEEEHMKNGEETHLTTLYAQTSAGKAEKPVLNLTEGAVIPSEAPEGINTYTLTSGLVAPDGTTATAAFFAAGYYLNELEFTVGDDGKARIGLSKTDVYPNDYEVVGEWNLYYYGDPDAVQREDYTSLIVNPNFDPEKGSKNEGRIDGWTTTAMNGYKEFTVSYNRAGFELYQDLTGLPAGKYEVTVHTYYRAGYWYDEEEHMKNGEETHLTTLYAQTSAGKAEKPVLNLTEGAVIASDAPEGINTYTLTSGLVAPDGTTATAAFFAAGYYLNSLEFNVGSDGKARIGLSKTEVYPNDYEVVGAWHLYYLGKPDGVKDIVTGTSDGTPAFYGIDGIRTRQPRRGINIVRGSDGSVRKVIVR